MNEKDQIPQKLWEVVTTLIDGMQQAAMRKAQDSGFDLEAGQIPFQETLINLSHDRDVLRDAIEKSRIVQLPLKLQYRLLAEATKVKSQLEALAGGTDSVLALESAVEDLSATIWQFSLQNLSPEVLAFESKMNELKAQEVQIKKVLSEARKIEKAIARLNESRQDAEKRLADIAKYEASANESSNLITELRLRCDAAVHASLGAASVIRENETEIIAFAVSARQSIAEIDQSKQNASKFETEIQELHDSFAEAKTQIQDLLSSADQTLDAAQKALAKEFVTTKETWEGDISALVEETNEKLDHAIGTATANFEKLKADADSAETQRQTRLKAALN